MNEDTSVPFPEFWNWVQALPLSEYIGFTWWFPFLESLHVLGVGVVVGSILMVDLRLLGKTALSVPASRMTREMIRWTWGAFVLAVITGTGLFMTRAAAWAGLPESHAATTSCMAGMITHRPRCLPWRPGLAASHD